MKRLDVLLAAALAAACQFPSYSVDSQSSAAGAAGASSPGPSLPGSGAGAPAAPDPCLQSPCQNAGKCVATLAGSLVCLCEPGYRGDYCEATFDNCDPDPCLNGGTCFDGDNAAFCDCPDGWDGATCERDHDDCADKPCLNGGVCTDAFKSRSCSCSPGFLGDDCEQGLLPTCRAILDVSPSAVDGVYMVDPDGPGQGNPPLEVECDMSTDGWTLVGQEREGVSGTLKFLGISVGDPRAIAHEGANGLIGEKFAGQYDEVWTTWSSSDDVGDGIYVRVSEHVFVNDVRTAIPVTDFYSTDTTLKDWVNAAGGAVLCRASQSPDIRPGDSSWAIKPRDDTNTVCGCNNPGWTGRGAFYGGHSDATTCNPSGGGWAGIADDKAPKGNIDGWWLQIWIR